MHAALLPNPALARAAAAARPLAAAPPPPPNFTAKHGPYGASSRLLFQFKSAEDLVKWTPFSDEELGGHSTAALTLAEEPQARGAGMSVQLAADCLQFTSSWQLHNRRCSFHIIQRYEHAVPCHASPPPCQLI